MKRRSFIKISGLGAGAFTLGACNSNEGKNDKQIPIEVLSDAGVGHILRNSSTFPEEDGGTLETIIIGGGVAGLTAYHQLQNHDVKIFELSNQWGGTSAAHHYKDLRFALGAHYDLAYPDYFGKEGTALLEKLNVVQFNELNKMWEFKDEELLIPSNRESNCWIDGKLLDDPIAHAEDFEKFRQLVSSFYGKLPMPTRNISDELWTLNQMTFKDYLDQKGPFSDTLYDGINYQMFDDYGGGIDQVSALAGLHYYACRPYDEEDIQLLSPPEGNYYFIQKLIAQSEVNQMYLKHLVSQVKPEENGYQVTVIDIENKVKKIFFSQSVIMAGKKHTLPYIFPFLNLTHKADYAPWVSVNLIMPKTFELTQPIWQNDVVGLDTAFQGFVNTSVQALTSKNLKSLTCYYCFTPERRGEVLDMQTHADPIVKQTIAYVEEVTGIGSLSPHIIQATVKLMGHAMAIPTPDFLGSDLNEKTPDNIAFCGVDNGCLPLFFEALDSGIVAAKKIERVLHQEGEVKA